MITAPRGGVLSQWGFLQGMSNELSRAGGNPYFSPYFSLIASRSSTGSPARYDFHPGHHLMCQRQKRPSSEDGFVSYRLRRGQSGQFGSLMVGSPSLVCGSGCIGRGTGVPSPGPGRGRFTTGTAAVSSWTITCQVNSTRAPRSPWVQVTEGPVSYREPTVLP